MESKGTNGWFLDKEGYLRDKNFDIIADFFITNQEDLANAKLASKAHEMLEKLAEVKDLLEAYPSEAEMHLKAVEIRQLIKEATEL